MKPTIVMWLWLFHLKVQVLKNVISLSDEACNAC